MISAQIDELRKWADQLSERENEFGVVVRALVASLRDAADTIWQLRDDLQRANAENAMLGELVRHMHTCMEHYEMDGTISCDRCPLDNDTGNCDFDRRMRELGVDA